MRYTTIRHDGAVSAARVEGDRLIVVDAPDAVAAMRGHGAVRDLAELDAWRRESIATDGCWCIST